jgi:hypothetical protein
VRIARLLVSPEFLRDALDLPAGTGIVRAGVADGCVELTITHADLRDVAPEDEARPPLICPTFHREDTAVLLVDWGQG